MDQRYLHPVFLLAFLFVALLALSLLLSEINYISIKTCYGALANPPFRAGHGDDFRDIPDSLLRREATGKIRNSSCSWKSLLSLHPFVRVTRGAKATLNDLLNDGKRFVDSFMRIVTNS
jgi:hypothetical protein